MISAEAFLQRNPVALEERCRAEQGERNVDAESSHRFARRGMGAVADDPNDADACREAALRLLDAAPRSSGALRERLLGKGYDEEIVNEVIERLIRVQLIDDRAYAESAVRYCAGRMMGRRGAVMELARKGVDRRLAEQVCGEAEQQGVFEDAAWELGRRVARKTRGLDRQVRQRRFWSAGGRKGHSPETLRRVAAELLSNNLPLTREVVRSAGGRDSRRSRKRINETSYTPGSVMPYANARHGWPSIST